MQLDYILASSHIDVTCAWNDNTLAIGLDHTSVHCHLDIPLSKPLRKPRKRVCLKHSQPFQNGDGQPSTFHAALENMKTGMRVLDCASLERCLFDAATVGGSCTQRSMRFQTSSSLNRMLADPKSWHFLSVAKSSMFSPKTQQHPQNEEFATLLEGLYAGCMACSAQPHLIHWECPRYMAEDLLSDVAQISSSKGSRRLPANHFDSFAIQDFCIHVISST